MMGAPIFNDPASAAPGALLARMKTVRWGGIFDRSQIRMCLGVPIAARPSTDFAGCGCELGGQHGKIHCGDVDCEGCAIRVDNETCRHLFIHFHRLKKLDRADIKPDGAPALEGARRRKHGERSVDGGICRHDEPGRLVFCGGPDGHFVFVSLHCGAHSGGHPADCHDASFRGDSTAATIAEAGGATSSTGGGAA